MEIDKNIYYISESIPHKGYGSFVVFFRHLVKLKNKGFKIILIIPEYENLTSANYYEEITSEFEVITIPWKAWWLLPYRFSNTISRYLRYVSLYIYLNKFFKINPPRFIITYFYSQYYNGFAAFLQSIYKCGLGAFLHDDKYLLFGTFDSQILKNRREYVKYDKNIYNACSVIWTVSKRLSIPDTNLSKYLVLPPIPEGGLKNSFRPIWQQKYSAPIIGFSGSIYESYIPLFRLLSKVLESFNGELIIVAKDKNKIQQDLGGHANITVISSFENNEDTKCFLGNRCSALFCGYPDDIENMPWLVSCFPSKLVEYSHIGLPVILSSPSETALADWCNERRWSLFLKEINYENIFATLKTLSIKEGWEKGSFETILVSQNEFDPARIQSEFEESFLGQQISP